jgi:hypothetical protein
MFRSRLWALGVGVLLALAGCTNARLVSTDATGGCVAVPNNSNVWPTFYHDQALALIRQSCPDGYAIDHEEEAVVGQTVHATTSTDKAGSPLAAAVGLAPAQDQVNTTTTSTNQTEWRIWYKRALKVGS